MRRRVIPWWRTNFGEAEIKAVSAAIRKGNISQGVVTQEFEEKLSQVLKVPHVIAASSGSAALAMAFMAIGIGRGDEIIMPNRGWIATPHAAWFLGVTPVFADVGRDRPVLHSRGVKRVITKRTKAIVPVHLNGRSADMKSILRIAGDHGLRVIEDAAQACFSRNGESILGTQGDIGCFSLSMAKMISTGQGGFVVTSDRRIADKLRSIRTQGVGNVTEPGFWGIPGFNFRLTDLQASIGLEQIKKLPQRIKKLKQIHDLYREGLQGCRGVEYLPVNCDLGEIPLYNEVLCNDRDELVSRLLDSKIETRRFLPNLSSAEYFDSARRRYRNSDRFQNHGVTLPSGPGQRLADIQLVIKCIRDSAAN